MKTPSKNSLISKMIRYPFWVVNCREEMKLPKTSCGYGFVGVVLGLLNIIIITNVLAFVLGTLEIVITLWLGEIFNLINYGENILVLEYANLVGSTILGALFFGFVGCVMSVPAGLLSVPILVILLIGQSYIRFNVGEYLCKASKAVSMNTLMLKVYDGVGKVFKLLKIALTSLCKKVHNKLCVPMEYKDD